MTKAFATASRSSSLYGTQRWKDERRVFLIGKTCIKCSAKAIIVDHEPPHRGNEAMFWNRATWQPMCSHHHNQKTGHETQQRRNPRREPEPHPGLIR